MGEPRYSVSTCLRLIIMKCRLRLLLSSFSILILLIVVIHYMAVLRWIWGPYDVGSYLTASADNYLHGPGADVYEQWDGIVQDKVVVVARLESEDTDWVEEYLPESDYRVPLFATLSRSNLTYSWQTAIYIVNPTDNTLHDPTALTASINKGHEAMPYLRYIIDHYHALPSTLVFLHAHRDGFSRAWHTDAPMHDSVLAMKALQLPFVQSSGYVNLRCNLTPGCEIQVDANTLVTDEVWESFFANASFSTISRPSRSQGSQPDETETSTALAGKKVPQLGSACCAQFAVSRDRVRGRPLEDYIWFRKWLLETEMQDEHSGRVFEYLWHIIFGMDPVQ